MTQVTIGHIEAAVTKIDNLDDQALDRLSETQGLQQTVLIGYILSAAEEYKNNELENLLIYYFTVIIESFMQAGLTPRTIEEKDIEEFEENYFHLLDEYFNTEDFNALEEFSGQSDLVKFMSSEIGMEDADGFTLDDETATQLFIVSLAMISLLSRASEKA
jgi:hypothetical protein